MQGTELADLVGSQGRRAAHVTTTSTSTSRLSGCCGAFVDQRPLVLGQRPEDADQHVAHGGGGESVEIARAACDRKERPTFEATDERQDDRFLVAVKMLTGPPEITVTVRWEASSEGSSASGTRQLDHQTGTSSVHRLVLGDRIKVPVGRPSWDDEATIKLYLHCTDVADENREWPIPHVLEWAAARPNIRWLG